jgi:hypothetical protein
MTDDFIVVYGVAWIRDHRHGLKLKKLWNVYISEFCDIFNLFKLLVDNINYQTNQVQPGETSQIQQLQVPNINQTEGSGHETSSQLEQIRHVQPDDTIVDMIQLMGPQMNTQMDMEEPLLSQGK